MFSDITLQRGAGGGMGGVRQLGESAAGWGGRPISWVPGLALPSLTPGMGPSPSLCPRCGAVADIIAGPG